MSAYSSLILASSPRAYYRLADVSGNIARDETTNYYNGTISASGVTLLQDNAIVPDYTDYSMLFDGRAGSIALPAGLSVTGIGALTVELWMNPTSIAATALVVSNDNNTGGDHLGFLLELTVAASFFVLGNGTISGTKQFSVPPIGSWSHICAVYDGAHLLVYVNGIPDSTTNPAITGTVGAATHNVTLGANVTGGNYYAGQLDEVAIYPSALSAATIQSHYSAGTTGRAGVTRFPTAYRRQS